MKPIGDDYDPRFFAWLYTERTHRLYKYHIPKKPSKRRKRIKDTAGYILYFYPQHHYSRQNGYVYEHRLVWEKYSKACLLPWADVHHKNGVKDDNRFENLEAIMYYDHRNLFHNGFYNGDTHSRLSKELPILLKKMGL